MKIERHFKDRMTIEEFAEKHDLIMEVYERDKGIATPFYARFKGAEIKDDGMLRSAHGNGYTEEEAINDYASEISEKVLVFGAYITNRKEIRVPILIKGMK